jgi:DNA-binding SARP family transcriptional activator/ABC-type branched-subunit amino acid transport system substrate-binding protein
VGLRFRVLGPVEVWQDGRELPLGTGRQRALLALLALHANELVAADRLVDELWEGKPPASATKVLQGYVSQLRRVLPEGSLLTRGSSYELRVDGSDAEDFERLVQQAAGESPREAVATLGSALELWRGRPFADFEYETWAQAESARLEELRLVAREERIDAELQLGAGTRLVPELESLVAEHPLRERLRAELMLALYRAGRQADALDTFAAGRRLLVDELGLEPAAELQELQRRILAHDPELGPVRAIRPVVGRRGARRLVLAGAVLLTGGVTALAVLLTGGGASGSSVPGDVLALVAPSGTHARTEAAFAAPQTSIAVGAGSIWTLNGDAATITAVDAASKRVLATFSAGQRAVDVAFGDGSFWVLSGGFYPNGYIAGHAVPPAITRFDARSHTPVETIPLRNVQPFFLKHRPGQHELAFGAGSLWVATADGRILRVDPQTGRIAKTIPGPQSATIVFAAGALWAGAIDTLQPEVDRVDPATNRITRRLPLPSVGLASFAVGFGSIWVSDAYTGEVWRITPGTPSVVQTIPNGVGATSVAVSNGAVWVGNEIGDTLSRIDPARDRVTRVLRVPVPQDISASSGGPLVVSGPVANQQALPSSSCGPVLYGGRGVPRFLIASDFAFHGFAAGNTAMARAVQLVLRQRGFRAGRYTIGYQSCDDSSDLAGIWDPGKCNENASLYAKTTKVIGVIGPFNSGCAAAELPILNQSPGGPVALIGPTTTYDVLTANVPGLPPGQLAHLYPTGVRSFARLQAREAAQVAADAVLAKQLGLKKVAVILDDSGSGSPSDTAFFRYSARKLGIATVVVPWHLARTTVGPVAARVARTHADGMFVAKGFADPGAFLVRAVRERLGARFPVITTDFFTPTSDVWKFVGRAALGMYMSYSGVLNSSLPAAGRRFLRQLGGVTPSFSTVYAGEAAEVLLDAIARSNGTRRSVVRELFATDVRDGLIGGVRFTKGGDPVSAPVTIVRVVAQKGLSFPDLGHSVLDRVIAAPLRIVHP